jgi:hypothetical protein
MRLEVFAVVLLEIQVFWDVMPCNWAGNKTDFFFVLLDPKDEGSMVLQNFVWYSH